MRKKIGFILVKPQIGENIGASARALKNFGFKDLSIVEPKTSWPNIKAKATSVGAYDIIKNAKIYKNIIDATKNYHITISLSARHRDLNKKHISIQDLKKILSAKKNLNYGFIFGPEASGLSNDDLAYTNYILTIPTNKNLKSLNLSHAVILVCFELFKILNIIKKPKIRKKNNIVSKKKMFETISFLESILEKRDFFKPKEKRRSMLLNIHNLFYKLGLNDKELRILASIIGTLNKKS